VTGGAPEGRPGLSYALSLANESYEWYKTAAIRSRRSYRFCEVALVIIAAGIPVAAAISPHSAIVPAVLGAVVVVLSSLRAVFHWQDNYIRFSGAREALEGERRLYHTQSQPYDDLATRDQNLAATVSRIERDEMAGWAKIAAQRPRQS
jgi:hypothetical protein